MGSQKKVKPLLKKDYIPNMAFDSVIFGFNGKELKILVLEYGNTGLFALPGGFIKKDESLDDAVKRGVLERTGLSKIYFDQFRTFGSLHRSDPSAMRRILEKNQLDVSAHEWLLDRFVSVAYYALINYEKVSLQPDSLSDSIDWYPIDGLPPLMMDHNEIVTAALQALRQNINSKLVGMNLLPHKFTMQELQRVNEAILDKPLQRTAFQRKMLASNTLVRHEKRFGGGAHKAPYLYSFSRES